MKILQKIKEEYITMGMHKCQYAFPRQKECTHDKQKQTPRKIYSKSKI